MLATPYQFDAKLSPIGCHLANAPRHMLWIAFAAAPLVLAPAWAAAAYSPQSWLNSLAGLVLMLLLTVSTVTDSSSCRIPNWTTYGAALWAIMLNAIGTFFATDSIGGVELGAIGLSSCLAGAGVGFFIMLVMYRLSGGGAGDVKLATAIGALVGPMVCLSVLVNTYIVAGVLIVGWLIWKVGPVVLFTTVARLAGSRMLPGWVAPPVFEHRELLNRPVPLAAFFAVGTMASIWQHSMF